MTDLLKVERVQKVYDVDDGWVQALENIDLTVRQGELISLVGPSGCGKSTLLNLIGGLDDPTEGSIQLNGSPIRGPRSREFGYVFQQPVLLPWRTIIDNVLLPVQMHRELDEKHRASAMSLLELVGLSGFENRYPSQLSGGMQQRASIVRALVHQPRILLMDEPFGALDAITRTQMNFELIRIHSTLNATIVFVTHDLHEAALLSDRIVVMTTRPGAIQRIVESAIPRPRTKSTTFSSEFNELVKTLGEILAAH